MAGTQTDQFLQIPLQPAEFQVGPDARLDFFKLERLRDIVQAAQGEGFHLVQRFIQGADKQDRYVFPLRVRLEPLADFSSI